MFLYKGDIFRTLLKKVVIERVFVLQCCEGSVLGSVSRVPMWAVRDGEAGHGRQRRPTNPRGARSGVMASSYLQGQSRRTLLQSREIWS